MFAQLTERKSLRDVEENFNTNHNHHYHLGVGQVKRSSLSDANNSPSPAIFMETFFFLLKKVRGNLPKKDASEMVRLIDSTTIDLNPNQFEWASLRSAKLVESKETNAEHILEDQVIHLTSVKDKTDCPFNLRRVTVVREEDDKVLSFIINDVDRTA